MHDNRNSALRRYVTYLRSLKSRLTVFVDLNSALLRLNVRWALRGVLLSKFASRHTLPSKLIVSLTSYPPRFSTLHYTLKCLLSQQMRPDAVILWVADGDFSLLPGNVLDLQPYGLQIKKCEDTKSYKKIIPCLMEFPDAAIAIADDDAYYHRGWLGGLVNNVDSDKKEILCYRAHKVKFKTATFEPLPYVNWEYNTQNQESSVLNFPTGVMGVLYMPRTFAGQVFNKDYLKYCPQGDDIWLFWMAIKNGATVRKVLSSQKMVVWNGSQDVALWRLNTVEDGNDRQIKNMITHYGNIWENASSSQ
jgi:hypothetical protein